MTATVQPLRPMNVSQPGSGSHACAWCGYELSTVPALLDHVVDAHLDAAA